MFSWPLGTTPYALTRAHSRYFVRTRSTLLLQWADNLGSALGHAVICTTYTTNKNIPCNTPPSPQRQFHARTYIWCRRIEHGTEAFLYGGSAMRLRRGVYRHCDTRRLQPPHWQSISMPGRPAAGGGGARKGMLPRTLKPGIESSPSLDQVGSTYSRACEVAAACGLLQREQQVELTHDTYFIKEAW